MSTENWENPFTSPMRGKLRGPRRSHDERGRGHGHERGHGRGRGRGRHEHHGYGPPGPGGPWAGMVPPVPPGGMVPPMPPMPPFPPGPGGFGPGFGHGHGRRGGRKARRGDVRAAILSLLSDGPNNGYQLMQAIAERSQGGWRPSPGAVYPALQQLTDEGLVQPTGEGRRTLYELTEEGRTYVDERAEEMAAPWEAMTPQFDDDVVELMRVAEQSGTALMQVLQSAGPVGRAKAKKVLEDGRRQLYQILAEGEPPAADDDGTGDE